LNLPLDIGPRRSPTLHPRQRSSSTTLAIDKNRMISHKALQTND
jgi:hypothetical protein